MCTRPAIESGRATEQAEILAQDNSRLDELEARLQELIHEQESEVTKLRAENARVKAL